MKSHQTKSLTRTQSPGKCGKNGEKESDLKEQNNRLPKVYKWSFQMCKYFLENTPCGIVQKGFLNVLYFGFLVSVLILLQLVTNPHLKQKGVFWWFFFFPFFAIAAQGTACHTLSGLFLDLAPELPCCSCCAMPTSHSGMNIICSVCFFC